MLSRAQVTAQSNKTDHRSLTNKQPFRKDSRLPTEGTALRLSLRDFATEELARGHIDLEREIVITSMQLCDFLTSAEARQQVQTQHQGSINRIRPGALKG